MLVSHTSLYTPLAASWNEAVYCARRIFTSHCGEHKKKHNFQTRTNSGLSENKNNSPMPGDLSNRNIVTETQQPKHKQLRRIWAECTNSQFNKYLCYFCHLEYTQIYPNHLYLETCCSVLDYIGKKLTKSLLNICFEHFLFPKFVPKLWPHLKTIYKFLKIKKQITLAQHPTNILHSHTSFVKYLDFLWYHLLCMVKSRI